MRAEYSDIDPRKTLNSGGCGSAAENSDAIFDQRSRLKGTVDTLCMGNYYVPNIHTESRFV